MRLIFLGPPGVGKGTQSQKLSEDLGVPKISTGDTLRDAVARKTPLGIQAKSFMDKGQLVPDDVVVGMVEERLKEDDCEKGYILDGFPRTTAQAEALSKILDKGGSGIDRVLDFTLPDDELVKRLSGRRSCPGCKEVFHLTFNPPAVEGKCDRCGSGLIQRDDDLPETIKKRLQVYREHAQKLIDYYGSQGVLKQIDGGGNPDDVFKRVRESIGNGK